VDCLNCSKRLELGARPLDSARDGSTRRVTARLGARASSRVRLRNPRCGQSQLRRRASDNTYSIWRQRRNDIAAGSIRRAPSLRLEAEVIVFQVRIHGRGGQGVVTAAEMLSIAAFLVQRYAQAFPSFGSERTGAPVVAYCRIDDQEIRLREPVIKPDALIVQDPTLLHQVDLFAGLAADGYVLINTNRSFAELGVSEYLGAFRPERLRTVPATELALKHIGRPVPNSALLGGFAAVTGLISLSAVVAAIKQKFSGKVADGNIAAATEAYEAAHA
jgi:pyruvate ferredoxin oxidoreductase gamma subunit